MQTFEILLAVVALAVAVFTRPWRLLGGEAGYALLTPLLATLVALPWLWALPSLQASALQLQWSGASLVLLMLGWPLAVPVFLAVGGIATLISPLPWEQALSMAVWQGVLPATLAVALGAALRRWVGTHPFVYVLGRGFLGTVACLFVSSVLSQWAGHVLPDVPGGLALVARWLTAWSDGFITGMLCAIFVAFKPEWLATWSDKLYLKR